MLAILISILAIAFFVARFKKKIVKLDVICLIFVLVVGNLCCTLLGVTLSIDFGYAEKERYISLPITEIEDLGTEYRIEYFVDEFSPDYMTIPKDEVLFFQADNGMSEFCVSEERIMMQPTIKYLFTPYVLQTSVVLSKYYEITIPTEAVR